MTLRRCTILAILAIMLLSETTRADVQPTANAIDAYVESYVANNEFSGVVFAENDYGILYQRSFGYADIAAKRKIEQSTMFVLASIAKAFTAAAIERLAIAGSLHLDDRSAKYVPEYRYAADITIRQLLAHSAGVPDYYAIPRFAVDRSRRLTLGQIFPMAKRVPAGLQAGG